MSCDCGTANCGCCAGVETVTPRRIDNRPGLGSIAARIGTHGAFLASMQARLSTLRIGDARPLAGLRTREHDDPSIALLDAFATAGDVLTFYNERIANEAYLRTATVFRSVQEIARLVGYTPRPGVAASTYLAFTIDPPTSTPVTIAADTRVRSVPGPDEEPQIFETSDPLVARAAWNTLGLRQSEPQQVIAGDGKLFLAGTTTGLKPGDALLVTFTDNPEPTPLRVIAIEIVGDRTVATTQAWAQKSVSRTALASDSAATAQPAATEATASFETRLGRLAAAASTPLSNAAHLVRSPVTSFASGSGATLQALGVASPAVRQTLAAALAGYDAAAPRQPARVYAMRLRAGLFGRAFAKKSATVRSQPTDKTEIIATNEIGEWPIVLQRGGAGKTASGRELPSRLSLDAAYDGIAVNSWVIVDMLPLTAKVDGALVRPAADLLVARVTAVDAKAGRADYGGSGDTTMLSLDTPWIKYQSLPRSAVRDAVTSTDQSIIDAEFQLVRRTIVYARPEELVLAERPIDAPFCADAGDVVELDALYADLEPGRYVIVSGERADIPGTRGVFASEVAMIASVINDVRTATGGARPRSSGETGDSAKDPGLTGDSIHSFVAFATPLSFCYRRDSVVIQGNVVKATHGETRRETIGNGDAATPNQAFTLKHKPLTWVAAATARGASSALDAYVDDIRWHPVDHLIDASPLDRSYMLRTTDDDTAVVFGDGTEGARPSTGQQNIVARYRTGIGRAGNVRARQIEQLADRPLGVRDVVNPRPATGGADPEDRDAARRNAPLATLALDRLVSVRDHANFARTFAGIAKADAERTRDGVRQVVHVTIAAEGDAPLDQSSDLLIALRRALGRLGDPFDPVQVAPRELRLLIIAADIRLEPDRLWEAVVADIRARAIDRFGFDARPLGAGLAAGAVIAALQGAPGVDYVDLNTFGSVATMATSNGMRVPITPDQTTAAVGALADTVAPWLDARRARFEDGLLLPAELLLLSPEVPATLILNEIT